MSGSTEMAKLRLWFVRDRRAPLVLAVLIGLAIFLTAEAISQSESETTKPSDFGALYFASGPSISGLGPLAVIEFEVAIENHESATGTSAYSVELQGHSLTTGQVTLPPGGVRYLKLRAPFTCSGGQVKVAVSTTSPSLRVSSATSCTAS